MYTDNSGRTGVLNQAEYGRPEDTPYSNALRRGASALMGAVQVLPYGLYYGMGGEFHTRGARVIPLTYQRGIQSIASVDYQPLINKPVPPLR
jgi:hypothetical protein